jgi:hypothetical protein
MPKMTPGQEVQYALDRNVSRDDLPEIAGPYTTACGWKSCPSGHQSAAASNLRISGLI